ncbi:MAG TPA: helix-turn-helix domain-containing protein [Nocardioidaceae bacterium]|nr:helix-turn-helix domain-containing protein [Nocardioidaceae bacterium]
MRRAPHSHAQERFGAYVRSQRQLARLSLRQAAAIARISNPYLSQIEHGLALPSVSVIRALADALHVSADHLLLLAAGIAAGDDPAGTTTTEDAIRQDPRLDEAQKHALLAVLASFLTPEQAAGGANGRAAPTTAAVQAAPLTPTSVDDGAAAAPSTPPRQRQKPKARAQKRKPHGNP